ncbi:hypothetical protein [uncultured Marinobacter sp.]|uniref:hypothetical protein n=1 Tax=uncultured Marinobacter sp. TaxID=187379 RepID=UPI0030D80C14
MLPLSVAQWLLVPVWVVCWQLVFTGVFEASRLRRRAWLGQYLKPESPWSHWLRGGILMFVLAQAGSALLALVLVVRLRQLVWSEGLALLMGLVVFLGLLVVLRRWLAGHVLADYVNPVCRRLLVYPVSLVLTLALVLISYWRPQPWYVGLSWNEAVAQGAANVHGDSLLAALQRSAQALEITQLWGMQNVSESLVAGSLLIALGWSLLLIMQAAFAWSFVRLLTGTHTLGDARRRGRAGKVNLGDSP